MTERFARLLPDRADGLRADDLRLGREPPQRGGVHHAGAVALEGRPLGRADPLDGLGDQALPHPPGRVALLARSISIGQ